MSKEEILTKSVKHLFNTISSEDILEDWKIAGKPINEGEKKLIIAEATNLLASRLWKILKADIQYKANQAMFEKAKTEADLTAGKLWLYTLDCIETKLKKLK